MSKELKKLLGDGAEAAGQVATAEGRTVDESPTVLKCDRWTQRAGKRLAEQWKEAGVQATTDDSPEISLPFAELSADALETLLSSGPRPAERPKEQQRARWWQQLLQSPETAALRTRTVAQPAIAEIAAAEIANQWLQYAVENVDEDPNDDSPEQQTKRIQSTRDAVKEAADAADTAEAVGAGLGLGTMTSLDASKLAEYTRKLRGSVNLAAMMRMAGRFMARARQLQRSRADLLGSEITGIELSGDIARLLPVEAALVAGVVPELELLAMARLAQRRSLSYKRILREPTAMGPIVVSVDESGSMGGDKIQAAKGLTLAMASIARAQKRPFLASAFSGTAEIRVASGNNPDALIEWLGGFFNGGTVLDGPLHTLPTTAWPAGPIGARADHIIITDDDVGLSDELRTEYVTWAKKMGVRTFGIGIGVADVDTLRLVCDAGCWCLPSLDLNNPAVDAILSIGPTKTEVRAA